jgi:hypothetical protein
MDNDEDGLIQDQPLERLKTSVTVVFQKYLLL